MKEQPVEPSANPDDPSESFALEGQFREELYGALDVEKIETCWGVDSRYWLWDYDKDVSEVYATDVSDWNIYGFTYSMDGDHVVIDFASKKRMKIAIVPFDEGISLTLSAVCLQRLLKVYGKRYAVGRKVPGCLRYDFIHAN